MGGEGAEGEGDAAARASVRGESIRGRRHAFSAEPWAAEAGALDRNTAWWAAGGAQAAEAESGF